MLFKHPVSEDRGTCDLRFYEKTPAIKGNSVAICSAFRARIFQGPISAAYEYLFRFRMFRKYYASVPIN